MEIFFPKNKITALLTYSLFVDSHATSQCLHVCVVIKMLMPGEVLLSKVLCAWTIAQVSAVRQAGEG